MLSKHGPDSAMCINSHWSEDHLVVEKIADDLSTILGLDKNSIQMDNFGPHTDTQTHRQTHS